VVVSTGAGGILGVLPASSSSSVVPPPLSRIMAKPKAIETAWA
jgi:hypothetical protein